MRNSLRIVLLLWLLACAGLAQAEKISAKALEAARQHGKARVLVMLQEDATIAPVTRNHGQARKQDIARKVDVVLARLPARSHAVRRRFALVPAIAMEADLAALQRLRDDPDVARIDLDLPGSGHAVAPDAASILNNVSPLQGLGFGGSGMKVAVIDSGVDTNHADLQSQLVGQQCFCSNSSGVGGCCPNGQATQSGAGAAEDNNGHGTNVSGIIVGQGNVSPRGAVPGAQLVVVKTLDANGSFCCSSDIVAAMDWIATHHPDVDAVNLSLGTSALFGGDCDTATSYTQAMGTAVNNLVALGVVVTASTGNNGNSNMASAPACVRNTVGVGATWDFSGGSQTFLGCTEASTAPKQTTCFTNRSTTTDLYAAGAFVTSTGFNGATSTYGGTSQAAPMVAACAVALKQAAPLSTVAQRNEAMRLSPGTVTDPVSTRSYPFLDCIDALQLIAPKSRHADFNGDGASDILWRNGGTGANTLWKSANSATPQAVTGMPDTAWKIVGLGDFNNDGKSDIVWRNATTGANTIWKSANSATPLTMSTVGSQTWKVVGIGDFNGDGKSDIFWRNDATGANTIWKSGNSATPQAATGITDLAWKVAGIGDFNGDRLADVLWRNTTTGANVIWKSANSATPQSVTAITDQAWKVVAIADYNNDDASDILWRNTSTGANVIWKSGNFATKQTVATSAPAWVAAP